MKVNKEYVSNNNTYEGNHPQYIVVHNTDNFAAGADASAHARAQHNGNLSTSVHYYTDDKDTVYQAAPHGRGCWHVGVNYGGRLFGTVNNKNSIGVEMCVQAGYDYNKAFTNTVEFVRQLVAETGWCSIMTCVRRTALHRSGQRECGRNLRGRLEMAVPDRLRMFLPIQRSWGRAWRLWSRWNIISGRRIKRWHSPWWICCRFICLRGKQRA